MNKRVRPRSVQELTSSYWLGLGPRAKASWVEKAFSYWRGRGFPHYELSRAEMRREFEGLCRITPDFVIQGDELRACTAGLRLANFFHPHMWRVPAGRYRTPRQAFSNDDTLRTCIRKALTLCRDRRPLSVNSLRRMLLSLTNTASVSNFRPAIASAVMQLYSGDGDVVLDFCAGFGGRALAASALQRKYIGFEASRQNARALKRMVGILTEMGLARGKVYIRSGRAEKLFAKIPTRSVSLVFTSPPYYNRERYSSDLDQSFLRYRTYSSWRDKFLKTAIAESSRVLRKGGKLVLNIGDYANYPISRDAFEACSKTLMFVRTYRLRIPLLPYQRNHSKETYKYEPVFVFER